MVDAAHADTWYKFSIVTGDAQANNERVLCVRRVLVWDIVVTLQVCVG